MPDKERNAGFVSVVKALMGLRQKEEPVKKTTEYRPAPDVFQGWMKAFRNWYYETVIAAKGRTDKYDKYKFLDENLAEASAALNIYADNIVSGAIGGEENYKVVIDEKAPNIQRIEEVVEKTEQRTGIKDFVWDISRDLTKFGDLWEEIVIGTSGKEYYIEKLKKLPTKEMYANVDERGAWKDPSYPYFQQFGTSEKDRIYFDDWRSIHFKVGQDVYGVDHSLFANASQRIGRQLLWIDDAMVMARISRAWMRYAYKVDVTGMSPDQIWEYLDNFMERIKRKEIIDESTGDISVMDAPWMPDEDIAIPTTEGSKQDIQVLTGDLNIGNIDDVRYFQNKFLMAVSVPKAYVALEEGTKSKATLSQIDIQFARQVRRRQHSINPGLRKFYSTAFILDGIQPDSFKWGIVFPELATVDEMMKWEMMKCKAEIAKLLVVDASVLNAHWVMKELLGMTDKQIERYAAVAPGAVEESLQRLQIPEETARLIRKDPYVRQILDEMRDLIAWRLEREEVMRDKKAVGLERTQSLKSKRDK